MIIFNNKNMRKRMKKKLHFRVQKSLSSILLLRKIIMKIPNVINFDKCQYNVISNEQKKNDNWINVIEK